jgi:hypothetical protein
MENMVGGVFVATLTFVFIIRARSKKHRLLAGNKESLTVSAPHESRTESFAPSKESLVLEKKICVGNMQGVNITMEIHELESLSSTFPSANLPTRYRSDLQPVEDDIILYETSVKRCVVQKTTEVSSRYFIFLNIMIIFIFLNIIVGIYMRRTALRDAFRSK